ncbi:MAG: AAA family ATPase [Candidatus Gracilibacteria bacterium]|jgi:dephospho-CoA kinase
MNQNNHIIALVGMCGAGKSVANDFFKEKGYESVYFGGITLSEVEKRGLEVNPANEKLVREELRKIHGPAAFAILNLPKIEEGLAKGNVIVDGLYSWSEYKILKEKFGENLIVIAVYAPPKDRYARLAKRVIRPISAEDAKKRDYAEIENIEKGGPIAMADYTLVNDGDLEKFMDQLKKISQ